MSAAAALVLHADCGRHDTGWSHPEHQGRLPAIVDAIYRDTPDLLPHLLQHEATPAGVEALLRVHTKGHVERVRMLAAHAERTGRPVMASGDTAVSGASWDAALAAAGCAIDAVRLVLEGDAATAFALARPPGHHATPDAIMGFCLFNNVAVAARAAQAEHGVGRVLIIDWDVHHGNGTQDAFWEDPSVYYLSLHQSPWYPGTGAADERGGGPGAGCTRNVPVAANTPAETYRTRFRDVVGTAFDEFQPELVLVSAGFDALRGDPLGGLLLEPADFHGMTRELLDATDGRLVLTLEGGYAPKRVGAAVVDTFRALCGLDPKDGNV